MSEESFQWSSDWTLGFRVWLERSGHAVLGKGRAELLVAIDRTNSISAAARDIGMSYRHAWVLVQEINQAAEFPLVLAAVGGKQGGGAQLTAAGRQAVNFFNALQSELASGASSALRRALKLPREADCIHLVAAVSLQEVVGQILAEYALRQPAIVVRAVYGASNELAEYLLGGMAADVFLAADAVHFERLEQAGVLAPDSRRALVQNSLAVVASPGRRLPVRKPADLLKPDIRRVALADPLSPLGKMSRAYLEQVGIYQALLPRVVQVDNSRAVLAALHTNCAEVGLAFGSETVIDDHCQVLFRAPGTQACVRYFGGVLGGSRQGDETARLLKFFASPTARSCFRRCGFQLAKVAAGV
ncbi:MAG TPA: molybdate ABC transporter substrate-binding protein, partial [Pirellulales bacterium]|nr:molybdate ABC transporter substrate-binding protein [Pirellulales bacterium]